MGLFKRIQRACISYIGSSDKKCKFLKKEGCKIGNNVKINGDLSIFGTEPYLISIGDDSLIASGVKIITHDGGVRVLNNLGYFDNSRADKVARVTVGKNVYIGTNAIILPGVTIGDNVIIGAASVVTKNVEDDTVVAGVPAKKICTIEDYYRKNKEKFNYTASMNYKQKKRYYTEKFFKTPTK